MLTHPWGNPLVATARKPHRTPTPTLCHTTLPYPTLPYPTLPYPTLPYPTLPHATLPSPTQAYPLHSTPTPPDPSPRAQHHCCRQRTPCFCANRSAIASVSSPCCTEMSSEPSSSSTDTTRRARSGLFISLGSNDVRRAIADAPGAAPSAPAPDTKTDGRGPPGAAPFAPAPPGLDNEADSGDRRAAEAAASASDPGTVSTEGSPANRSPNWSHEMVVPEDVSCKGNIGEPTKHQHGNKATHTQQQERRRTSKHAHIPTMMHHHTNRKTHPHPHVPPHAPTPTTLTEMT
jgi:hypothetical protein